MIPFKNSLFAVYYFAPFKATTMQNNSHNKRFNSIIVEHCAPHRTETKLFIKVARREN